MFTSIKGMWVFFGVCLSLATFQCLQLFPSKSLKNVFNPNSPVPPPRGSGLTGLGFSKAPGDSGRTPGSGPCSPGSWAQCCFELVFRGADQHLSSRQLGSEWEKDPFIYERSGLH